MDATTFPSMTAICFALIGSSEGVVGTGTLGPLTCGASGPPAWAVVLVNLNECDDELAAVTWLNFLAKAVAARDINGKWLRELEASFGTWLACEVGAAFEVAAALAERRTVRGFGIGAS